MRTQQAEVMGFFNGYLQPVNVVSVRHAAEAPDCIQCQVNCIELNVRDGVQQGGQTAGGKRRALGDIKVRAQFRPGGATGQTLRCLKMLIRYY